MLLYRSEETGQGGGSGGVEEEMAQQDRMGDGGPSDEGMGGEERDKHKIDII